MPYIYRIDLSGSTVNKEKINRGHKYEFYAGRALSSKVVSDEVPGNADPFGLENKFIISAGFLTGTPTPNSGRLSIGSKSPLTNGVKEANVGGKAPAILASYDIRALVFEGIAPEWKIAIIGDDGLRLEDGRKYTGLSNYALAETLRSDYGDNIGAFTVGIAGDKKFANATVASIDMEGYPSRHAGRGGMGGVMGSKRLKAVVLLPKKGSNIHYADKKSFLSVSKPWFKDLHEAKRTFSKYGTAITVSGMNESHGLPTKNFRRGTFKDAGKIGGDALHAYLQENKGKWSVACSPGCAIHCSNMVIGPDGEHITSSLEYETIALNGSNLLIGDIEALAWIDHYTDDVGMDSIETGNCLAMFMEAGKIEWGDSEAVMKLLRGVKDDNPESLLLGLGVKRLGEKLDVERIPHVKGQGFPGYEPRSYKGMGVTFATNPMGADHTAGPAIMNRRAYADRYYKEDQPADPEHKVQLSRELQIFIMLMDSMGLCFFVGPSYESTEKLTQLLYYRYGEGWEKTAEDWIKWAEECLKMEHAYNVKSGLGPETDTLPEFILKEKLEDVDRIWDIDESEIREFWDNF